MSLLHWNRVAVATAPTEDPVTLAEAKEFAYIPVDNCDHDDQLTMFIKAATDRFDGPQGIGLALCAQTWTLSLDAFPSDTIYLPGWPVKTVTTVGYVDPDGASQTVAGADWKLDVLGDRARLDPAFGKSWPSTRDETGAVTITYTLGEAASSVKNELKVAILQLVAHFFEHREEGNEATLQMLPHGATNIMEQYRRSYVSA